MDNFSDEFERIRKDRLGVVKSEVYEGIKKLVSQIYPDKVHFIYELLQNAEDAEAHTVRFILHRDELIFCHDGKKQFDINDIRSITNIGSSTKEDDYIKVGKFGIGFKSVYAFSNTPRIYCDTINFKIEDLLLPTEIEPNPERIPGVTEFHFPFDSPKITPEEAVKRIEDGFEEIEETTLLFLRNIDTIESTFTNDRKRTCKRISNEDEDLVELDIIYNNGSIFKSFWRKFSRQGEMNEKEFQVDVAFPLMKDQENNFRYPIRDGKVFMMFPAKNERSNLKFSINAPFACTPTRDSIRIEYEVNGDFINEISILMADVIRKLKENNKLTIDFLSVLPLNTDHIPHYYDPIQKTINDLFFEGQYLRDVSGNYVSAGNAIIFHPDAKYKNVFNIEDIRYLFGNNNLQFIDCDSIPDKATERISDKKPDRILKFLDQLGVKRISAKDILEKVSELPDEELYEWISGKSNDELIGIYACLSAPMQKVRNCVIDNRGGENTEIYYNFQTLRIVKGADDEFHIPKDVRIPVEGVQIPQQYIPVHQAVLKNNEAVLFCKGIDVIEFNEKERDNYFDKREKSDFTERIKAINVEDDDALEVAQYVLTFYDSHKDYDFKNIKFIWTNTDSHIDSAPVLASPQECFLDTPFIDETGFRLAVKIHGKKEISPDYLNLEERVRKSWISFLIKQGIFYKLNIIKQTYSKRGRGSYDDYNVTSLASYFELKEPSLNRYIWNYFLKSGNWKKSYEFYEGYRNETVETSLLRTLRCSAWVLDKDGNMQCPKQVSKDTIAEDWRVLENNQFLLAIEFGKQQEIEKKQELERQQLSDNAKKEAALTLGFSSTKEALDAKQICQDISELKEYGIDIYELLDRERKRRADEERRSLEKQTPSELMKEMESNPPQDNTYLLDDGSFYVSAFENSRSEVRRAIENEKEPHGKISVSRQSVSNTEEREFVKEEYNGRCQICGKIIVKKNRERYFEAINLFPTDRIQDKYLSGYSKGWNTLCLCPNCAAEYKYGFVSVGHFFEKALGTSIDPIYKGTYNFDIVMQGEDRVLHYTPNHLRSLQTALQIFGVHNDAVDELTFGLEENNDVDNETSNTADNEIILDVAYAIPSGDKCPKCGKSSSVGKRAKIRGKSGQIYSVWGLICSCGTIYFTHRQRKKFPSDIEVHECN